MRKLIIGLIIQLFISNNAYSLDSGWSPLTDLTRPNCNSKMECLLKNKKNKQLFQIYFDLVIEKDKMTTLRKLRIKNLKTKKEQVFKTPEVESVYPDSLYGVFAFDANNDGHYDIAVRAALTNKLGELFYYFIYNPKENIFVMSDKPLPSIRKSKGKNLVSQVNHDQYRVEKNYKLRLIKRKKGNPN